MPMTFNLQRDAMRGIFAGLAVLFAASLARASTIGSPVIADGYVFTNFDFPNSGNAAGAGANSNGISNNGAAVGFSIDNNGMFTDFIRNPDGSFLPLNTSGASPLAFGINSAGSVVGQNNNAAFYLPLGGSPQTLAVPADSTAFGINDQGGIVGQFTTPSSTPGFFLANSGASTFVQINAPSGPNIVNAQGINNNGLTVGFYVGADGQDHGFTTNIRNANNNSLGSTAVADPALPSVPGEPGATFVFSQILAVNDNGIAVGYYGDSTTSQHGFLYNTNTGSYVFLDDPSEAFENGVEVTQITGITDLGEITGFYSDASGVFHGFVGCPVGITCPNVGSSPVPEPAPQVLGSFGLAVLGFTCFRRRRNSRA